MRRKDREEWGGVRDGRRKEARGGWYVSTNG